MFEFFACEPAAVTLADQLACSQIWRNQGLIVAGLFAGAIGVLALVLNYLRTSNDRRRLANDTFVNAVEQLGSAEINVRLGAIYALERIAIEEQRYHWPIMETLSAYVRERAPWPPVEDAGQAIGEALQHAFQTGAEADGADAGEDCGKDNANPGPKRAPTDIQTVLTVIGRRPRKRREIRPWAWPVRYWAKREVDGLRRVIYDIGSPTWEVYFCKIVLPFFAALSAEAKLVQPARIDLRYTDLRYSDMRNGEFSRTQFACSNLEGADMRGAHMKGANLAQANLRNVNRHHVQIGGDFHSDAMFIFGAAWKVQLEGADLREARMEGADLRGTNFKDADLRSAHMREVRFFRARMDGATLFGTNLEGIDLRWVSLKGANLGEARLDGTRFTKEPKELGADWNDECPPTGKYIVDVS